MAETPVEPSLLLEQIRNLTVNRSGDRRAPHKPLLVLVALARLQQGEDKLPFAEVERSLEPLLDAFAPPVQARHQPELPYWHLQGDGIWEVDGHSVALTVACHGAAVQGSAQHG